MYDKKAFEFKDTKYRSSILTNGLGKSGERALLYATGMDEEDIKKPFVAVIGAFSEMGGISSLAAAINMPGIILSHPAIHTIASK